MISCVLGALMVIGYGSHSSRAETWNATIFSSEPDGAAFRGELGIVRPSYDTPSLFAAYCFLTGRRITFQTPAIIPGETTQSESQESDRHAKTSVERWLQARIMAGAPADASPINTERGLEGQRGWLWYYSNCGNDAFDNASQTLADRLKVFGNHSPEVQAWLLAQDQVFANCSGGEHLPADAADDSPPLMRADRSYQIAAAHFYAEHLDEAKTRFDAIEQDSSSPWSHLAPYLSARALIRKATLIPEEGFDRAIMTQAEAQLQRVLADPSRSDLHPAARHLMDMVRNRLHPGDRAHELVEKWMQPGAPIMADEMRDYIRIVHRDQLEHPDEFTDWLQTFHDDFPWLRRNGTTQANQAFALDHALERWQATGSLPWLIAVLTKIPAAHPGTGVVLESAASVQPDSPAFLTVRFHLARLLAESGRDAEARERLNALLKDDGKQLPPSTRNLVFALRMKLAQDLGEFLRYAPRVPVARDVSFGHAEGTEPASLDAPPELDSDATWVLNEELPLATLLQVAASDRWPAGIRRNVTRAAWVRAVLLGQRSVVDNLLPVVNGLLPERQREFDAYRVASGDEARRFALALLLLKSPGLTPRIEQGPGRNCAVEQLAHNWAVNWWCNEKPDQRRRSWLSPESPILKALYREDPPSKAAFVSNAERDAATAEQRQLAEVGVGPTYIGRTVLAWAKKQPGDPRIPEALHALVDAGHWGCNDDDTVSISKTAFQLLHKRYAQTEWAKKTRYWCGAAN